jgi:hypothetical protein
MVSGNPESALDQNKWLTAAVNRCATQNQIDASYPTSSLQFSSAFLTTTMNWSAMAPSMMRWS